MREWIAPTRCAGCGAPHQGRLCDGCVPVAVHRAASPTGVVRGTWTLAGYDAPLAQAVRRAKYHADRALMASLGDALGARLAPAVRGAGFSAVVGAPSPWTRRLRRGFSPAAVLATQVGRHCDLPVIDALIVGPGPQQAALDGTARRRALAGRVRSRCRVTGRVLLIDDVATTGATAEACATELLGDAADEVWLATVCVRRAEVRDGT